MFWDFHFCFYAKPWTSQSVTYLSFSLSAQLSKMFQCPYIDTVVSAYVPGVITCINSLLVLYFFFASLLNILMSLLDAHLTCPPLGTIILTLFRAGFLAKFTCFQSHNYKTQYPDSCGCLLPKHPELMVKYCVFVVSFNSMLSFWENQTFPCSRAERKLYLGGLCIHMCWLCSCPMETERLYVTPALSSTRYSLKPE